MKAVVEIKRNSKRKSSSDGNKNIGVPKTKEPKLLERKSTIVRATAELFSNATLLPTTINYNSTILPDAIFLATSSGQLITTPVNPIQQTNLLQQQEQTFKSSGLQLRDDGIEEKEKVKKIIKKTSSQKADRVDAAAKQNNNNNNESKPSATDLQLLKPHGEEEEEEDDDEEEVEEEQNENILVVERQESKPKKKKKKKNNNNNPLTSVQFTNTPPTPANVVKLETVEESSSTTEKTEENTSDKISIAASPIELHQQDSTTNIFTSTALSVIEQPNSKFAPINSITPNTTQILAANTTGLPATAFVVTGGGRTDKDSSVALTAAPQTIGGAATFANFPLIASGLTTGNLTGFTTNQANFTTFSLQSPLLTPGLTIPLYNSLVTVATKDSGILPGLTKELFTAGPTSVTNSNKTKQKTTTKTSKKKNSLNSNTNSLVSQNGNNNNGMTTSRGRKRTAQSRLPAKLKEPAAVARRNARERRRVKMVNDGFLRLRRHVPTEPKNKKLSKVKTLRLAIEYIDHLQQLLQTDTSSSKQLGSHQSIVNSFTAQLTDYDDLDDDLDTDGWLHSDSLVSCSCIF